MSNDFFMMEKDNYKRKMEWMVKKSGVNFIEIDEAIENLVRNTPSVFDDFFFYYVEIYKEVSFKHAVSFFYNLSTRGFKGGEAGERLNKALGIL